MSGTQSREMLAVARANLDRAGRRNCLVRQGDMYQLPLPDLSFDLAIIHQVLHYAEEPGEVIQEAARVLRPGGRLILVDIRGHGASAKPDCCYARLDFAYDLKLLLDHLHVQHADVVGHSLGSIIAQTLAEYWPERVRRVVLIASTGGPRKGAPAKPPSFDFVSEIKKLKEPIDPDSAFMIAWWDSPKPVNAEFIRRQRRDAAGIPLRVWLAVIDQGLTGDDLQATLPWLKAPVLLLWGSDDPIMEEGVRQTLREALPAAQVKIFAGLGHNPFWEDPQQVAAAINGFLHEPR